MSNVQETIIEVTKQVKSILEDKTNKLKVINDKINDISIELSEKKKALSDAMDNMNENEFKKVSGKITELENMLMMYQTKKEQLQSNEFISEHESDAVIDKLLALQEENAQDYAREIEPYLRTVLEISQRYWKDVLDIESLITLWSNQVHENYNSRGKVVVNGSTRLPYTTPVRTTPYMGCKEFNIIDDTLKKLSLTRAGVGLIQDNK